MLNVTLQTRRPLCAPTRWPFATLGAAVVLAACGGGGSDAIVSTSPAVVAKAPEPAFGDNSATATTLATETRRALGASQQVAAMPMPSARSVLQAVVAGSTTVACPFGGSWSHDLPALPQPNVAYHLSFAQCEFVDQQVFQGSYTVSYTSFASLDSMRWSGSFNFSLTVPGEPLRQLAGTHECSTQGGSVSCTLNDGERNYSGSFNYSAGRVQGSYVWRLDANTELTFNFADWTAQGGSATVTGPGGFSATVVRTGANSFSVSIKGGSPHTITLTG